MAQRLTALDRLRLRRIARENPDAPTPPPVPIFQFLSSTATTNTNISSKASSPKGNTTQSSLNFDFTAVDSPGDGDNRLSTCTTTSTTNQNPKSTSKRTTKRRRSKRDSIDDLSEVGSSMYQDDSHRYDTLNDDGDDYDDDKQHDYNHDDYYYQSQSNSKPPISLTHSNNRKIRAGSSISPISSALSVVDTTLNSIVDVDFDFDSPGFLNEEGGGRGRERERERGVKPNGDVGMAVYDAINSEIDNTNEGNDLDVDDDDYGNFGVGDYDEEDEDEEDASGKKFNPSSPSLMKRKREIASSSPYRNKDKNKKRNDAEAGAGAEAGASSSHSKIETNITTAAVKPPPISIPTVKKAKEAKPIKVKHVPTPSVQTIPSDVLVILANYLVTSGGKRGLDSLSKSFHEYNCTKSEGSNSNIGGVLDIEKSVILQVFKEIGERSESVKGRGAWGVKEEFKYLIKEKGEEKNKTKAKVVAGDNINSDGDGGDTMTNASSVQQSPLPSPAGGGGMVGELFDNGVPLTEIAFAISTFERVSLRFLDKIAASENPLEMIDKYGDHNENTGLIYLIVKNLKSKVAEPDESGLSMHDLILKNTSLTANLSYLKKQKIKIKDEIVEIKAKIGENEREGKVIERVVKEVKKGGREVDWVLGFLKEVKG